MKSILIGPEGRKEVEIELSQESQKYLDDLKKKFVANAPSTKKNAKINV